MDITEQLFNHSDEKYGDFHSSLVPGIPRELFIGVRVPDIRKIAKEYIKEEESKQFVHNLPHKYYDENLLHAVLLSEYKDYDECIRCLDEFLPYVNNWAVCDIISPKVFKKHKQELLLKIKEWVASERTYTCRFGIEMLMSHFLDSDFKQEYLNIPAEVVSDEYYVNMMIAWFFATALAKQWDAAIPYIEEGKLSIWVHNKTIQKSRESFRISDERKQYLKSLKK